MSPIKKHLKRGVILLVETMEQRNTPKATASGPLICKKHL